MHTTTLLKQISPLKGAYFASFKLIIISKNREIEIFVRRCQERTG